MHKNVLFRGCTRPAMFLGVPTIPFFVGAGGCFMLSVYVHFALIFLTPIVIFIMRMMARRDEMIFRLLGLNWQFRLRARNMREHEGMLVFSPHVHRINQPVGKQRNMKGPFVISGKLTRGNAKA
jgi:type IV secretion system protein VirB3